MNLTVQQLRAVVVVARERSFSQAGRVLHLSQSALSRTVAEVEGRVRGQLFDRSTRHVALTPLGEEVVRIAESLVEAYETGMRHIEGYQSGSRGTVRIGALPTAAATLLPPVVAAFRQAHPDCEVIVHDGLHAQVEEMVLTGQVDLGLTAAGLEGHERQARHPLSFTPLVRDAFRCLCPPEHPFAAREHLAWEELREEPFIRFDTSSSIRAHLDAAFGEVPHVVVDARNVAAVGGMVAAGLGISVVPALVVPLVGFAGIADVMVTSPAVKRTLGILAHRERPVSSALRAFRAMLDEAPSGALPLPRGVEWVD